mgnify:FL=1
MIAVFDTNIIIDALNGISQADNEYRRYQRVLISRITWMEVLVGTQDQEEEALVRDFLDSHFEIIPLDLDVAEMAIRLRRLHHMRLPDAIIWATARIHAAELVSRNTKDFKPEWDGIRVPYTL